MTEPRPPTLPTPRTQEPPSRDSQEATSQSKDCRRRPEGHGQVRPGREDLVASPRLVSARSRRVLTASSPFAHRRNPEAEKKWLEAEAKVRSRCRGSVAPRRRTLMMWGWRTAERIRGGAEEEGRGTETHRCTCGGWVGMPEWRSELRVSVSQEETRKLQREEMLSTGRSHAIETAEARYGSTSSLLGTFELKSLCDPQTRGTPCGGRRPRSETHWKGMLWRYMYNPWRMLLNQSFYRRLRSSRNSTLAREQPRRWRIEQRL